MREMLFMPLVVAFFLIGCNRVEDHIQPVDLINKIDKPKLVVFIVVDQGMPELLEK